MVVSNWLLGCSLTEWKGPVWPSRVMTEFPECLVNFGQPWLFPTICQLPGSTLNLKSIARGNWEGLGQDLHKSLTSACLLSPVGSGTLKAEVWTLQLPLLDYCVVRAFTAGWVRKSGPGGKNKQRKGPRVC